MDSFTLHLITDELQQIITGSRINKIYQPDNNIFLLKLSVSVNLLINISSSFSTLFLTKRKPENPASAPPFCMLLRKYLENGHIIHLENIRFYRIFILKIKKKGEIYSLKINLSGKSSNVLLLNNSNNIIANYKNFPERKITHVAKLTYDQFKSLSGKNLNLPGFPPFLTKEISYIAETHSVDLAYETYKNLFKFEFVPQPCTFEGKVYPFPLTCKGDKCEYEFFSSFSKAFESLYSNNEVLLKKKKLLKTISSREKKLTKALKSIEKELSQKSNYNDFFKYGELLKANIHLLKKGMNNISVTDYYSDNFPQIEIKLQEDKTPLENVEFYFKIAKKGKRGVEKLNERIQQIEEELAFLKELSYFTETTTNISELEYMEQELNPKENVKIKSIKSAPFDRIVHENITVIVGKSSKANDFIRKEFGKPDYLWFHVKDYPGSHVIVLEKEENLKSNVIKFAAKKALENSKCFKNGKGEVIYTKIKYVKKQKGSPPGLVSVKKHKTMSVKLY